MGRRVWGLLAEEAKVEPSVAFIRYTFNELKAPPGAACARGAPAQVQTLSEEIKWMMRLLTTPPGLLQGALGISLASRRGISSPIYYLWAGV